MKVFLDSSFLLECARSKIDLFREFERLLGKPELSVLSKTLEELDGVARKGSGADKDAVRISRLFLQKLTIEDVADAGVLDDLLVEFSKRDHAGVASQDRELKRRVRLAGLPIFTIRKRQYIMQE